MMTGVDNEKRRFLTKAASVAGAVGAGFLAVPFVTSMQPSAKAEALGIRLGLECREDPREIPPDDFWDRVLQKLPAPTFGYWHDFGHAAAKEYLGLIDHEQQAREAQLASLRIDFGADFRLLPVARPRGFLQRVFHRVQNDFARNGFLARHRIGDLQEFKSVRADRHASSP